MLRQLTFVTPKLAALLLISLTACSEAKSEKAVPVPVETAGDVQGKPFKPWPDAAKVQLFIDDGDLGGLKVALANGPVDTLSNEERAEFESALSILTPESGYGEAASCFIPHHFFRYIADDGAVLGDIEICFCCGGNSVSPKPDLPENAWIEEDIVRIEALVKKMGHPVNVGC